jgi:hypothetical protein
VDLVLEHPAEFRITVFSPFLPSYPLNSEFLF